MNWLFILLGGYFILVILYYIFKYIFCSEDNPDSENWLSAIFAILIIIVFCVSCNSCLDENTGSSIEELERATFERAMRQQGIRP